MACRLSWSPCLTALRLAALFSPGLGAPAFAQDMWAGVAKFRVASQVQASDNAIRDEVLVARLRTSLAGLEGRAFSSTLVELLLAGPRSRLLVGKIDYRVLDAPSVGSLVLRVEVSTSGDTSSPAQTLQFPNLYRDDRSYLTAFLNGGFGLYSDRNDTLSHFASACRRNAPAIAHRHITHRFDAAHQHGQRQIGHVKTTTMPGVWNNSKH